MENTIIINGKEYVAKDSINTKKVDGMKYVLVRTRSAGVFAGYLKSEDGQTVVLNNARRIWKWEGAASLSQLAMSGTSRPEGCMFPEEVSEVKLFETIEILDVTEKAKASIASVEIWKA